MNRKLLTRPVRAIMLLIAIFYVLTTFVCYAQRPFFLPYGVQELKPDSTTNSTDVGTPSITFANDDIVYLVLSEDDKTVGIVNSNDIPPKVVIPECVTYNNQKYVVKEIGIKAFYDTESVSITIPNTVTYIGHSAFAFCSKLTSIIIPESVTSIGYDVLSDCTSLTTVTIPKSLVSIGSGTFDKCMSLRSINVEPGNKNYTSVDGILFNKNETEIVSFPCGRTGNYAIPSSVTTIGDYAFSGCSGLTSITIPSSVSFIGDCAFEGCSNLTSITIPSSVTSIGDYAFSCCSGLKSISIPSSVTSIGNQAFIRCKGLTSISIPSSVTSISNSMFWDCTSLSSITIPSSVTSIGASAFSECSNLTSITIPSSVTSIGYHAFSGCSGLTSITIPNSVTSIDGNVFRFCSTLKDINVDPDNKNYSSHNGVLFNKNGTELIVYPPGRTGDFSIPESVTKIGTQAFATCTGLKSLTIPQSITYIGESAFDYCSLNPLLILTKNCEFASRFIGFLNKDSVIKAYDIDPLKELIERYSFIGYTVEFMPPETE